MLSIDDVHRKFGTHEVLCGVTLSVPNGSALVLRGRNGTGKSTLCEIVAGVLEPDSGSVTVDGRSLRDPLARAAIGYAPSDATVPEHLFVYEWLELVAVLRGVTEVETIDTAITRWELHEVNQARLSSLSLGEHKRLALAAACVGEPTLLILDEPTVGLDASGLNTLMTWVREHVAGGGMALIASHEPTLAAELGARTATLSQGRLTPAIQL